MNYEWTYVDAKTDEQAVNILESDKVIGNFTKVCRLDTHEIQLIAIIMVLHLRSLKKQIDISMGPYAILRWHLRMMGIRQAEQEHSSWILNHSPVPGAKMIPF
jgi:hypothetical protein